MSEYQPQEGDERIRLYTADERAAAAASTERLIGRADPEMSFVASVERWDGQEWEEWRGLWPEDLRSTGQD
jgi:hypothetical protein